MNTVEKLVASQLLEVEAVKLRPNEPFTWASGWKSPIYCDNRKTLSYPKVRSTIKLELARLILEKYPDVEVIAGVATGAIAQGALVADALGLPFVYVHPTPKDHGLENQIEGELRPRQSVVIVENQVNVGSNCLKVVKALKDSSCKVLGVVTIFDYGFASTYKKLEKAGVDLIALTNLETVLQHAENMNIIDGEDSKAIHSWQRKPSKWTK